MPHYRGSLQGPPWVCVIGLMGALPPNPLCEWKEGPSLLTLRSTAAEREVSREGPRAAAAARHMDARSSIRSKTRSV